MHIILLGGAVKGFKDYRRTDDSTAYCFALHKVLSWITYLLVDGKTLLLDSRSTQLQECTPSGRDNLLLEPGLDISLPLVKWVLLLSIRASQ